MYIPYEKIGKLISFFFPEKQKKSISSFFLELKILANCKYIKQNRIIVHKYLKNIYGKRKIRVAFLCDDSSKWKCQSLYELFLNSDEFHPFVLATKNDAPSYSSKPMTVQDVLNTYKFFKDKGIETYYAFDVEKGKFIPVKKFKPDLIFYQQPWYIHTSQGPVVSSKFALTYYVPYFIANVSSPMEYDLRFHRYLYRYYVLNEIVRDFYAERMKNKGENLKVTGHTQLDYFYLHPNKDNCARDFVIYAPHWSINYPPENYATFEWNGKEILEFAKKHPDIKWVFKPHPILKHRLLTQKIMKEDEIEKYWRAWAEVGIVHEDGDYMDIFEKSRALITDCGSFLTEFFLTKQPVILLVSDKAMPYNPSAQKIVKNYYKANNIKDVYRLFDEIILNKRDVMKQQRLDALDRLGFLSVYVAKNIINDIKEDIGC